VACVEKRLPGSPGGRFAWRPGGTNPGAKANTAPPLPAGAASILSGSESLCTCRRSGLTWFRCGWRRLAQCIDERIKPARRQSEKFRFQMEAS